jgi:hypothetical protein
MKNAWKLAVGFVLGLAIIAGLARTLSEDLEHDTPVIPPASAEVTRAPPPPAPPAVAKREHTPEPRPVATKRRKKRPSGATTPTVAPIEASLPDSPSPTPDPTPPRTDLDAPLPH